MTNLLSEFICEVIDNTIQEHGHSITEKIVENTSDEMTTEEICGIMTANCLSLSAKISVQITLELLQQFGYLKLDSASMEKFLRKRSFSVVKVHEDSFS